MWAALKLSIKSISLPDFVGERIALPLTQIYGDKYTVSYIFFDCNIIYHCQRKRLMAGDQWSPLHSTKATVLFFDTLDPHTLWAALFCPPRTADITKIHNNFRVFFLKLSIILLDEPRVL